MWTDIDRIRSTPPAIICLTVISLVSSLINSLFFFLSRSSVPTFTNLQEETLIKIADVLDEVDNHIHIHYSCERSCRERKKKNVGTRQQRGFLLSGPPFIFSVITQRLLLLLRPCKPVHSLRWFMQKVWERKREKKKSEKIKKKTRKWPVRNKCIVIDLISLSLFLFGFGFVRWPKS